MSDTNDAVAPQVQVQQDGPYVVSGSVPVRRTREVTTERDEPLTWQTTQRLETDETVALCRCGASSQKPFCDGSHAENDFDGTEAAPTDNYDDRARTYEGTGITMRDDRKICEHAGFCGNKVTNVWKMVRKSGTDDTEVRSQLVAMIERCPSGALTYRLPDGDEDIEPELPVAVGVVDDGPLFISGGMPIERSDGEQFESRNRVTLCRCGGSSIKPLCDGSHAEIGFTDH